MARLGLLLLPGVLATASGSQAQTSGMLRADRGAPADQGSGFVRALEFDHRLRVCNAYPNAAEIAVYRGKHELTSKGSMPYKACQDFQTLLKAGDKLEFKAGDAELGTFSVSSLPNNDAVLLLVVHRHDDLSTAVAFESHVFASLLNAQVAVIDTFRGNGSSTPRIQDPEDQGKSSRSEELRYNSVVAVNPGVYDVVLPGLDGKSSVKQPLVALNRESYVVLRTGVQAKQGTSYPQELVVYPASNPGELRRSKKSGAARGAGPAAAAAAAASAALAISTVFSLC